MGIFRKSITNSSVYLLAQVYLLAILFFTLFRSILFGIQYYTCPNEVYTASEIAHAFFNGLRFDIVICGYIMLLPATVLTILENFQKQIYLAERLIYYWIATLFVLSFAVCMADIPYFLQFNERFSIGAFMWMDSPGFVLQFIFREPTHYLFMLLFILSSCIFIKSLKNIFSSKRSLRIPIFLNIILSILVLGSIFLGIRGRIQRKSPIRISTAYFGTNPFLNKLGLNPNFTLIKSYLESLNDHNKTLSLMEKDKAIALVQKYLNIDKPEFDSPVARRITPDTIATEKYNVVLIMMEGMSAANMAYFGNTNNLTPFLDSLAHRSIFFTNIYTAGKHTFNGIFSTLHSFPALYRQHTMKNLTPYNGMSESLYRLGYSTTFFVNHDDTFDSMGGFLRSNYFQKVYSQQDYPLSEVKNNLGVPDDFMFRYSLPIIEELSQKDSPFFVSYMTASNHSPYYLPPYYEATAKKDQKKMIQYADWSLKLFFNKASEHSWFKNTIFVLIADHGRAYDVTYDVPLNYFHTPLIIYAPHIFSKPRVEKMIGSQIDVYPTIMGLLNLPYINNSMGIDLLREKRPYAILNDDDKVGIIDSTHLCIMWKDQVGMFNYRTKDLTNHINKYPDKAQNMTDYAKAHMQVHQNMISNKQTRIEIQSR